jgi:transcriptional regulator with XRE-family HTH domain
MLRGIREMAKRRVDDYEDSEEYIALKRAVGKRIRTLRVAKGLSAKNLADLAEISTTNFAVIESGYANVTLLSLDRIAKALVVPLVSLFEDGPALTTTGVEGVLVRLTADLDRVRKQMEERRDELAQVSADLQGFVDANQAALSALAADAKLSPRAAKK